MISHLIVYSKYNQVLLLLLLLLLLYRQLLQSKTMARLATKVPSFSCPTTMQAVLVFVCVI